MKEDHEIEINTVADRIRNIRKALDLKGKEFAEQVKISAPSLSEIENGKYLPNFDLIVNLSKELNVNLNYLILGRGPMFINPKNIDGSNQLEEMAKNSKEIQLLLYYFERSDIMRFYLLSQFKLKMMMEKETIDKEIQLFSLENLAAEREEKIRGDD